MFPMHGRAIAPRLATGLLAAGGPPPPPPRGAPAASQSAPDTASFPAPDGRTLAQFLEQEADGEGPVVSPAGQLFRKGENRYPFGVFTTGGDQIDDAEVGIYAARGDDGEAEGPYPARVESLEVDPQFESKTSADDPDSARTVYVADVPMDAD